MAGGKVIRVPELFEASIAAILQSHDYGREYFEKENASIPVFNKVSEVTEARGDLVNFKMCLFDKLESKSIPHLEFSSSPYNLLTSIATGLRQSTRLSIALVSIPKQQVPGRPDLNFIHPTATHKVSNTHHALTLFHGPAVNGIG